MTTCTAQRHGDESAYSWWGCRCPAAREAWRIYKKRLREGRQPAAFVDSTGPARRMQAMVAMGHGWRALASHLGCSPRRAADLGHQVDPVVHRTVAERVAALFAELANTQPPPGHAATYARTVARRHGWVTAAAWDNIDDPNERPNVGGAVDVDFDEVLVERAVAGKSRWGQLPAPDRLETVRRLRARGLGRGTIAGLLDMSGGTLQEYLAKHADELAVAA